MEDKNILSEIKKLQHAIGRKLFEMHSANSKQIHPSPLQMEIISFLLKKENENIFLKDLQEEFKISKAAISDAVDKMAKKGFLEKAPFKEDARKTKLNLREKGKDIYLELEGNVQKINEEVLKGISKKELEEFCRISHKIEMNLEKEGRK